MNTSTPTADTGTAPGARAQAQASPPPAFQPLVVIPVYDHEHAIGAMVDGVRSNGNTCLLVDDGSRASCAAVLRDLAHREGVQLLRLEHNQGKGGAMLAGFREAARQGATHVLQIDADGQHDTRDIPRFLVAAAAEPGAIINGITSGLDAEDDGIAFDLGYAQTGKDDDWRWGEQWLPHAAWYMYAISLPHD